MHHPAIPLAELQEALVLITDAAELEKQQVDCMLMRCVCGQWHLIIILPASIPVSFMALLWAIYAEQDLHAERLPATGRVQSYMLCALPSLASLGAPSNLLGS